MREFLPHLKGLGIQCQSPVWTWISRYPANDDLEISEDAWKYWRVLGCADGWAPSVTIALEAMIWRKKRNAVPWNPDLTDQQAVIRVIRKGIELSGGDAQEPADWEVEVQKSGPLAEQKRCAKWKAWWRLGELKNFV